MTASASALKGIARGSGFVLASTAAGMLLQFVSGILVIRAVSKDEYGLYSLAIVIIGMLSSVSLLGFTNGVSQLISKCFAENDTKRAWGLIVSSVSIVSGASLVAGVGLYVLAGSLASVFDKPSVQPVLEFTAWMVTPLAVTQMLITVFRGFGIAFPKALFQDIATRVFRITGVGIVLVLGWGLSGILWSTLVATYLTAVLLFFYTVKHLPKLVQPARTDWLGYEIIKYSLPLFGTSIVVILLTTSSTVLLGYFSSAEEVAIYSAPRPFSQVLELPLIALGFVYLPIATSLFKTDGKGAVKNLYNSATKWSTLQSIPVFLLFLMDSEYLVTTIFGSEYESSSNIMSILALGSFIHIALGPNGMMLITFEKRQQLLLSTMIAATINILLGIMLIPMMGAIGAAIATASALVVSNLAINYTLYKVSGIFPMRWPDFFVILGLVIAGILLYSGFHSLKLHSGLWHGLIFFLVCLLCLAGPVLVRNLNANDLLLISSIEQKFTRHSKLSKRLARYCKVDYKF